MPGGYEQQLAANAAGYGLVCLNVLVSDILIGCDAYLFTEFVAAGPCWADEWCSAGILWEPGTPRLSNHRSTPYGPEYFISVG